MKGKIVFVIMALGCLLSYCAIPPRPAVPASSPGEAAYTAPAPSMTMAKTSTRLDDQLDSLTDQLVNDLKGDQKFKIAIIEFSDLDGDVSNLGRYISEEITTRLYKTKRFQVLERELLAKVMEEHKLNLSGLIDESTAVEVGAILGVDAIGTGTISDLGRFVKVNARMISTERGSIFAAASVEIFKGDRVRSLLFVPGEGEKSAGYHPSEAPVQNLTAMAAITASTVFGPRYKAANVGDGIIGIKNRGEWATKYQQEGAWIFLRWTAPKEISKVVLCDRSNVRAHVLEGTLAFSDGSSIKTGPLPNKGHPKEFAFEPKYVEWLKFTVDYAQGSCIGLSEIQVFGR